MRTPLRRISYLDVCAANHDQSVLQSLYAINAVLLISYNLAQGFPGTLEWWRIYLEVVMPSTSLNNTQGVISMRNSLSLKWSGIIMFATQLSRNHSIFFYPGVLWLSRFNILIRTLKPVITKLRN
jgi:hypothetical protein